LNQYSALCSIGVVFSQPSCRLLHLQAANKGEVSKDQLGPKPVVAKYGLNHVTALVEAKKAKLVVIAHDVTPIEVNDATSSLTWCVFPSLWLAPYLSDHGKAQISI
jgi:hypothetical protein